MLELISALCFQVLKALCFEASFPGTGMYFTAQPIGQDTAAMPMQAPHCPQVSLSVLANLFRSSTIIT